MDENKLYILMENMKEDKFYSLKEKCNDKKERKDIFGKTKEVCTIYGAKSKKKCSIKNCKLFQGW
ncbi:TPA: hypothetical protein UL242_002469 [Clostridioides difficile]|uniref:hypothetical protein n=1 Tax=Clostridioides difficile TaxID=1496 RepID=UPI001A241045|nr:hypothetical protein [Clostridioides difficile]EGT3642405.1 hypothetical protein [Clostridioides difficile]ELX4552661.1 hypothetical protein [Clostridioides difficile]MBH7167667.1 hypothetical protein [Clostridioides difficile]MBH7846529.1 hypothetical protein [Clostridioides difficile]MBY1660737.1 hypothetical protein [Clostridioides difficile]